MSQTLNKHYYYNIHGWFDFQDVYLDMIAKAPDTAHFVEVGSWFGRSAAFMGIEIKNSEKNIKLDCVDLWAYTDDDPVYKDFFSQIKVDMMLIFVDNMMKAEVSDVIKPVKLDSLTACKKYEDESLDFVFIDANHNYEFVKNDINAWYAKVKPGSYIGGHDYDDNHPGVKQAVDEIFKNDKTISGSSWLHLKK